MQEKHFVGLDCGNSSFRILLGTYDGQNITTEVVEQIPHDMVRIGAYYYWDLLKILDRFKDALKT
ncbi:MAG: rhamnulokinase, partial [Oscillospiraceae bacterium]